VNSKVKIGKKDMKYIKRLIKEDKRRMEKERWCGPTFRTRWQMPLRATTWPSTISLMLNLRELSATKGQ
jgi:hypothetical protein